MTEYEKTRRRKKVCLMMMAATVVITIVLVTLGLTVFKARDPEVQMNAITLETFRIQSGIQSGIQSSSSLNMSLLLDATVRNPNRERLDYHDGVTRLFYYGDPVGQARLPARTIRPKAEENDYVLLVVEAGARVLGNANLPGDIVRGRLPVVATTTVEGIVKVLGVFKHHAVSTCHCYISIFVANATIQSFSCRPGMRI